MTKNSGRVQSGTPAFKKGETDVKTASHNNDSRRATKIRALHVGTSAKGGAGLAQLRIAAAIEARSRNQLQVACDHFFAKEATPRAKLKFRARRLSGRVMVGLHRIWSRKVPLILGSSDLRTVARYHSGLAEAINRTDYDLVHLHWIGDQVLSIEEIGQIEKPIVWTFHDMWPLGGAEHYPSTTSPTPRPERPMTFGRLIQWRLKSWVLNSIDNSVVNRKKLHWGKQLVAVSPSQWLLEHIAEDDVFSRMPHTRIPNPVSIPALTDATRSTAFGGDQPNRLNLLFVSSSGIGDPRKGWNMLEPAISVLKDLLPVELREKLTLTVVGPGAPPRDLRGVQVSHAGELGQEQLADVYLDAVLTLMPSTFDNFPNVALESMSFGTPVIGSRNTGIAEIVSHEVDGGLVDWQSPTAAAAFIAALLKDRDRLAKFSRNCLLKVSAEFGEEVVGNAYLKLYLDTLNAGRI